MALTRLEALLTAKDDTGRAFRSLKANLATVDRAFINLTKVAAGLGTVFGGLFVRDLVKVNKNFQSLQASLITFTGSTQNAAGAFEILKQFAKTTPFSLDEVVGSFNILLAQGIKPTEKQLRNFADIAGGSSKSILQFAEAVADASVGEFERLKEFGIKAKKEGEKLTLSIGDFTKEIKNDSTSILAALAEIGAVKFAGGAERQAQTLGGAFTNLRDTVDEFMFQIGEAGLSKELSNTVRSMTAVIGGNQSLAQSISDVGVKAIRYFVDAIRFMRNNLETLFNVFRVVFGALVIKAIINLGTKLLFLGKIVASVTVAFGALNRAIFLIPAIVAAAIGATAALIGKFDSLKNGISDAVKEADEYLGVTETAKQLTDRLGLSTLLTTDAFNQFKNKNVDLNGVIERNVESLQNIYDRMGDLKKVTDDTFSAGAKKGIEEYFETIKSEAENAKQLTSNAFRSMQDTLSEFFQTGKLNFKGFLQSMSKAIADFMAKQALQNFMKFLGMGGDSGKSGGFNIGSIFAKILPSFFGAPSNPSANMSGPELYYHNGGMLNKTSGIRLGSEERMIVARTGERILNRGQEMLSSQTDGGIVINQTINLSTGVQQTVRAEIMSMAPQIAAQAKAAVLDAKRRGGGFSAAFA